MENSEVQAKANRELKQPHNPVPNPFTEEGSISATIGQANGITPARNKLYKLLSSVYFTFIVLILLSIMFITNSLCLS